MIHHLKIGQDYLNNLTAGRKKAEVRLNDRDYQLGDVLHFVDHATSERIEHYFIITHIHAGLGLQDGYVVLSLSKTELGSF